MMEIDVPEIAAEIAAGARALRVRVNAPADAALRAKPQAGT